VRDFSHPSRSALVSTQPPILVECGVSFPALKRPGVALTNHLNLAPNLQEKYSDTSAPLLGSHDLF